MVNIEFLLIVYLVGMSVDWIVQHNWQAVNKSRWGKDKSVNSAIALLTHSGIYAFLTTIITTLLICDAHNPPAMFTFLFVTHAIVDNRVLVKLIMRLRGIPKDLIDDIQKTGFLQIGIDQRLHEISLLILAIIIK